MIVEKIAVVNLDRNSSSLKKCQTAIHICPRTLLNSDETGVNKSHEMLEEMEVFGQVEPYEGEPCA